MSLARGCLDGADAAQCRERGLAAQAIGVVAGGDQQGGGAVGADASLFEQRGCVSGDRVGDALFQVADLVGQLQDPAG
jgi:hypothetical protein